MRKIAIANRLVFYPLAFLIFIGCVSTTKVAPGTLVFQRVISVNGSQTQIYDSSMVWLVKTLGSAEDILDPLEYRNRETGEVIRKASVTVRSKKEWGGVVTLDFSINIQARDNESKITIDDIAKSPSEIHQSKYIHKNEISEIERQVELIMDSYEDFIIERSLEEDWYQADSEPSEKLFL